MEGLLQFLGDAQWIEESYLLIRAMNLNIDTMKEMQTTSISTGNSRYT